MIGDLRISFKTVPAIGNKQYSLRLLVSVNGTRFCMTLKDQELSHSLKNEPSYYMRENTPSVKKKMDAISAILFRLYKEALLHGKHITAQELKKQFVSPSYSPTLYEIICHSHHNTLLLIGKSITYEQYKFQQKTIQMMSQFCQMTYGIPDISISALPDSFPTQLYDYLSQHSTEREDIIKERTHLILTYLQNEHKRSNIFLPASILKILVEHKPAPKLTSEDLTRLSNVSLTHSHEVIRDAFIFSCRTGLNYAGIIRLSGKNLKTVSDQSLWLFTVSGQYPLSSLPDCLLSILKSKKNNEPLFRLPSIQYVNTSLRTIAMKSGVQTDITFKLARKYYISHSSTTGTKTRLIKYSSG